MRNEDADTTVVLVEELIHDGQDANGSGQGIRTKRPGADIANTHAAKNKRGPGRPSSKGRAPGSGHHLSKKRRAFDDMDTVQPLTLDLSC